MRGWSRTAGVVVKTIARAPPGVSSSALAVNPVDTALLVAVNRARSPGLSALAAWASAWGMHAMLAALVLGGLRTRTRVDAARARDGALVFFAATFVAETVLKPLVGRPRPTASDAVVARLVLDGPRPPASSLSFPSGTATACFAAAAWIHLAWGARAGALAWAFAAVVAWSRLYAGLHWPSDLLGGALVGAAVAWAVHRLSRWITPPVA